MNRHAVAVVHSGYWGLYLLLVSLFLVAAGLPHGQGHPLAALLLAWPIAVIAIAPNAAAFYAWHGPLFSRFLARRRFAALFAGGAAVSLAACALGLVLAWVFFGTRQPAFSAFGEFTALIILLSGMAAVHGAIALVIRGFLRWYGHAAEPPAPEARLPVRPAVREFIFVKTEQRLEKVRLDEILVIEGQRDYRRIHTPARRIMTLQTFAEFERQIPPDIVCRVHKSYMVALGRIDAVERGRIAIQHLTVPISDTYRDRFYTLIGHR